MKIKKKIKITTEQEVIVDCICNMCGSSLYRAEDLYGLEEISYIGGYSSGPTIRDEEFFSFSLCENCLGNIIQQFKIPAKIYSSRSAFLDDSQTSEESDHVLSEIYDIKNEQELAKFLLDSNEMIRSYALLRIQQLKNP